jgi:general secretion pathway protein G
MAIAGALMGAAGGRRSGGYTLVELLIVLAVLGILASLAAPLAELTVQREKERELKRALWEIRDAIDAYRRARESGAMVAPSGASSYPPDLLALTAPIPDGRAERRGEVLRFLRRVPRDPFADPTLAPELTWGLRSYLSDAINPQPGVDVYDVYSKSEAKALNGVPLRQW